MVAPLTHTGKRVLVVDDDPAVRETLTILLEEEGYQVAAAANGQEALNQLREGARANLILLDLMMPVVNGWEFRILQQQDPALSEIPVVVISADETGIKSASSLGVKDSLKKPIALEDLLRVVGRYCEGAEKL